MCSAVVRGVVVLSVCEGVVCNDVCVFVRVFRCVWSRGEFDRGVACLYS
jgi:hypothetical protein